MNENRSSGSYYELGLNYGKKLKGLFNPPPAPKQKIELMYECEEVIKRYAPGIIEEIKGLATGAEVDLELLKVFLLLLGIEPGCTVYAISSEYTDSGFPIIARNYDWFDWVAEFFTVNWIKPTDKYSSVSFSDHFVGRYGGANENGLAVAITAVPAGRNKITPGIRMNLSNRWMLDSFKSTKEAVTFLETVPHVTHHTFLIADKDDNFARVETDTEDVSVTYSVDGFLATTNHYQAEKMLKYETPENIPLTSKSRLEYVIKWFKANKQKIGLENIKNMLKDHKSGVCAHGSWDGMSASTLWSWIAPLGKRKLLLCEGSPCENEYKELEY